MSFFQKRRWLVEFGVVCLVPIVLIGLFLMQTLQSNVEGRALSNAREQARLVADVGLSTPLAGVDDLSHGLTTGQLQDVDRQVSSIRSGGAPCAPSSPSPRSAPAARPPRRRSRRCPTASPGCRTARCSPTSCSRRSPARAGASTRAR